MILWFLPRQGLTDHEALYHYRGLCDRVAEQVATMASSKLSCISIEY